jgi:hypothetical protein
VATIGKSPRGRDQKTADKVERQKITSVDIFGRTISIIALLLSGFTFALQFVAHDEVSYSLPQITNARWSTNAYFAISLNVFNSGNRAAALVSANARLIERNLSDHRQVTDANCEIAATETAHVRGLYAGNPEEKLGPSLGEVYKYEASIEAGKLYESNLIFRIFGKSDKTEIKTEDQDIEGVVCLDLIFAASTGVTYITSRAIYGVHFQFEREQFQAIEAADLAGNRKLVPVTVIDDRRIELPF